MTDLTSEIVHSEQQKVNAQCTVHTQGPDGFSSVR